MAGKRRSSRQRIASRRNILKAQKVSARKRRGVRKGVLVGIGTAAVLGTGIAAYRSYDRRTERNQHTYLMNKALNIRLAKLPLQESGEGGHQVIEKMLMGKRKIPNQPRRYSKRPASIQTKLSIQQHRKKVLGTRTGSMINVLENTVTGRSPVELSISKRSTPMAPWKPHYQSLSFRKRTTHTLQQRVGNNTFTLILNRRS